MSNISLNNQLFCYVIRVHKQDSAFIYFQLEAQEGMAFYSTIKHVNGQIFRDISIKGHISMQKEIEHFFKYLKNKIQFEFLIG